jgi:DNA-binding Xre family transcriptional regulator
MKKLALILTFSMTSIFASGQCDYETNEIDKFEGVKKVVTKSVIIRKGFSDYPTVMMSFGRLDTTFFIRLNVYSGLRICVNGESYLQILTKEGTKYKLMHSNDVVCYEPQKYNKELTAFFEVSKSELEDLKTKKLSAIRLMTTDGALDVDLVEKNIAKKKCEAVLRNIDCVLVD